MNEARVVKAQVNFNTRVEETWGVAKGETLYPFTTEESAWQAIAGGLDEEKGYLPWPFEWHEVVE